MNFPPLNLCRKIQWVGAVFRSSFACFKCSSFIQETTMEESLCARPYTWPLDTETKKAQHLSSKTW